MHWLGEGPDDGSDPCAHGRVELSVGQVVFVSPEDGDVTLSTSGLLLLRTFESDHIPDPDGFDTQLFPCCGQAIWMTDDGLLFMNCPNGVDISVRTTGREVTLASGDRAATIPRQVWMAAVLDFVAQVEQFYASSARRAVLDDPPQGSGWSSLWDEWKLRVERARPG